MMGHEWGIDGKCEIFIIIPTKANTAKGYRNHQPIGMPHFTRIFYFSENGVFARLTAEQAQKKAPGFPGATIKY